jgi:regulator of replication initiation timing
LGANYGRGLFKQLQETIEQVEKLTAEIREIKSAHQMETASLKTEIESLRKENTALKTENQKLKAIINIEAKSETMTRLGINCHF